MDKNKVEYSLYFLALAALAMAGCQERDREKAECIKQRAELQEQQAQCVRESSSLREQVSRLNGEVESLRGFGKDRLENLVYPVKGELGRFTRGYDTDKDGIDDGVIAYLVLLDRQGDTIKAAGSVEIELWDLAETSDQAKLGTWEYPIRELQKHWLTGVMANHYRFELPWAADRRPKHNNVTVKLRFVCSLTGDAIEIQKLVEVKAEGKN
jgi:hypothetical protein